MLGFVISKKIDLEEKAMAICDWCEKEVLEVDDCPANTEVEFPDGTKMPSVPYPEEETAPCHDCNVAPGKHHHPGCDAEQCPQCGGQLGNCGCLDEDEEDDFSLD